MCKPTCPSGTRQSRGSTRLRTCCSGSAASVMMAGKQLCCGRQQAALWTGEESPPAGVGNLGSLI